MLDARHDSAGNRFRARRLAAFLGMAYEVAAGKGRCRIADLGGTSGYWKIWAPFVDWSKINVVCFNLDPDHCGVDFDRVAVVTGDATRLDGVESGSFDLVHSNSVIEHVGRHRFAAFAREVRRIGSGCFVQTPNYWFPVEPHARAPFVHWLPECWAARLLMRRGLGFWPRAGSMREAIRTLHSAELLSRPKFAGLFGDAEIVGERFGGLTKSLIAVKRPMPV